MNVSPATPSHGETPRGNATGGVPQNAEFAAPAEVPFAEGIAGPSHAAASERDRRTVPIVDRAGADS